MLRGGPIFIRTLEALVGAAGFRGALEDDASLVVLKVPEAVTLPSVQGRSIA